MFLLGGGFHGILDELVDDGVHHVLVDHLMRR